MRLVIQRVRRARVTWDGGESGIGAGLCILVGSGAADDEGTAERMAAKVAGWRIFADAEGKTNLSVQEIGGEALAVSQFTLFADLRRGRRPSFLGAGDPRHAERIYLRFAQALEAQGVPTRTGSFGAEMLVEIANDGPVTLVASSDEWPTQVIR